MTVDQASVAAMIALARQEPSGLGPLLERYRGFLVTEGQRHIGIGPAAGGDVEDLVQDTFLKALRKFPQFAGATEREFSAWLWTIYANSLTDLLRKRRRVACHVEPCFGGGDGSASFVWYDPVAAQSTPSRRMIKAEKALRLAALLQTLPEGQRDAVRLRHLEGWPLEKIAAELGRSVTAAASLIKRGLYALRDAMSEDSWMSAH